MTFANIVEQVAEKIADAKKQEIIDALFFILEDSVDIDDFTAKIAENIDIVKEVVDFILDS